MSEPPGAQAESRQDSAATPAEPLIGRKYGFIAAVVLVLVLAVLAVLVVLAVRYPSHTQTFRDIAIIGLAAESGLIGLAMIVLIVQVARLTNMLEFEIKPILENASDTVRTVRGTAAFMSEHMVSPVIKASSFVSGFGRLAGTLGRLFSLGSRPGTRKKGSGDDGKTIAGGKQ